VEASEEGQGSHRTVEPMMMMMMMMMMTILSYLYLQMVELWLVSVVRSSASICVLVARGRLQGDE
jgi:hypothetical protein